MSSPDKSGQALQDFSNTEYGVNNLLIRQFLFAFGTKNRQTVICICAFYDFGVKLKKQKEIPDKTSSFCLTKYNVYHKKLKQRLARNALENHAKTPSNKHNFSLFLRNNHLFWENQTLILLFIAFKRVKMQKINRQILTTIHQI